MPIACARASISPDVRAYGVGTGPDYCESAPVTACVRAWPDYTGQGDNVRAWPSHLRSTDPYVPSAFRAYEAPAKSFFCARAHTGTDLPGIKVVRAYVRERTPESRTPSPSHIHRLGTTRRDTPDESLVGRVVVFHEGEFKEINRIVRYGKPSTEPGVSQIRAYTEASRPQHGRGRFHVRAHRRAPASSTGWKHLYTARV